MPVFISWSGERSRLVASDLSSFLEATVRGVSAWMSQENLGPGPWQETLRRVLDSSNYGILCLTADNFNSPWLLFEAGAISKQFEKAFVVPYLLNVAAADLEPPLSLFQSFPADEDGTWTLVKSVASTLPAPPKEAALRTEFDARWPAFRDRIAPIRDAKSEASARLLREAHRRMRDFGSRVSGIWFERIDRSGVGLFRLRVDERHNSVRVDNGRFYNTRGRFVAEYRSAVVRLDEEHGREGIVYLRECYNSDRDKDPETWFHGYGTMWFEGPDPPAPYDRGTGRFLDGDVRNPRKLIPLSATVRRVTDPSEVEIVERGPEAARKALAKDMLKRSL